MNTREIVSLNTNHVISQIEYVLNTQQQGKRTGEWIRFICPAHDDTDHSASWNVERHGWHCFTCSARGGYIDLAYRLGIERPVKEPETETVVGRWHVRNFDGTVVGTQIRKELPTGKSEHQVYRDARGGKLPFVAKVGSTYVIPMAAWERWQKDPQGFG